jgi:hypothetical protein
MTPTLVGQSLKIDTFKTSSVDTNSITRWQCHAGPSALPNYSCPLVIINGKIFENCLLQNLFFKVDTTTISSIQVLNTSNDSIKLYGKAGKNGVIIITTKRPFEWVSAKQILKQKSNAILSFHKPTLIKVDNALFDTDEELFFQKDLINKISVINSTIEYYTDRQYNSVLKITLKKKSGT